VTVAVGIEKIGAYPTTGVLDMSTLCEARGVDVSEVRDKLLVHQRGVNPPWEDAVTMAVNAGASLLSETDREAIGLLIVASESAVDQEKPLSSWVHNYLGLTARCRNFEIKHACYGATGGLQLALSWLASAHARGRKALIISTDQSLIALGQPYEPVTGAGAVAVLLSDAPRMIEYELDRCGYYSADVSDVFRPTPRVETGNSESSLFSYLEALEEAFDHYAEQAPDVLAEAGYFDWCVYHMPFAGMARRAHRTVLRRVRKYSSAEIAEDYDRRVHPSTRFAVQMGGVYGASTFVGLLGLIDGAPAVQANQRIGIFAYGSGLCGEFQSAMILPAARAVAAETDLQAQLDARRSLTLDEYEAAERERDANIMARDFAPDRLAADAWYIGQYEGRKRLILEEVQDYYRHYAWS